MEMLIFLFVLAVVLTLVLVIAVLGRLGRLGDRLERMSAMLTRLGERLNPEAARAVPESPHVEMPAPAPLAFEAAPEPVAAAPEPVPIEPEAELPPWIRFAPPIDAGVKEARRPKKHKPAASPESLETAIGQRWLVRVGAIVLVVGAGFFYAYAIEQGWINPKQRAISGALAGLLLMGLGLLFNRRGFKPLAQGFVACGAGVLFLDAFASHRFYDLIDGRVALLCMGAVTALTAAIALRWSAMPLVLLAQIGGCLAPVLLRDERADRALVVFSYLFVLDAGFLLVASIKRWRPVELLAAAATPVLFMIAATRDTSYPPEHVAAWACTFDLLFLATIVMPSILRREQLAPVSWGIAAAAALGTAAVAEISLMPAHPQALALVLAGLGAVHAVFAESLWPRLRSDTGREVLRACAGAFALDALRMPFDRPATTLAFAAAGMAFAILSSLRGSLAFRVAGIIAFGVAIGRVISLHLHGAFPLPVEPVWNVHFAVGMTVAAVIAASSLVERENRWIGMTTAALLGIIVFSGEVDFLIQQSGGDPGYRSALVAVSNVVMATAVVVGFARAAVPKQRWQLVCIAVLIAVVGAIQFSEASQWLQRPSQLLVFNPICLGTLVLPLGLLGAARVLRGGPATWQPVSIGMTIFGVALPLSTLSIEAHRYFTNHPLLNTPVDAASAAVSVTWALYAALLLTIGISKRLRAIRLAALALLGVTLVKVVVHDLADVGRLARIASFIALGIVLMAGAWAYHRFADRIFGARPSPAVK